MVFSPCPRRQQSTNSLPNSRPVQPATEPLPPDAALGPSSSVNTLNQERLAFEAIFNLSPSRKRTQTAKMAEPAGEIDQFPRRSTASTAKQLQSKSSRLSLTQFSHKVRRRLSKEYRTQTKRKQTPGHFGSEDVTGSGNATPTAHVANAGSDDEYDSDAHCIRTPQITERTSGGGIDSHRRNLSDIESAQEPSETNPDIFTSGFDGSTPGGLDGASSLQIRRPGNLDTMLANTYKDKEGRPIPSRYPVSTPTPDSDVPYTPLQQPPREHVERQNISPGLGSPLARHNRNPSIPSRSDKRPPLPKFQRLYPWKGADEARQSQNQSGDESNRSSTAALDSELQRSNSEDGCHTAEAKGQSAFNHDSLDIFNSKFTKSPKSSKSPGNSRQSQSTPGLEDASGTRSRFIEDFNSRYSGTSSDLAIQNCSGGKGETTRRSVSDGWLSAGRRQGYGYNFVTDSEGGSPSSNQHDMDARVDWKTSVGRDQLSPTSSTRQGGNSRSVSQPSRMLRNDSGSVYGSTERMDEYEAPGNWKSVGAGPSEPRRAQDDVGNDNRRLPLSSAWARFPSHLRNARMDEPAGLSDDVIVRDFATTQVPKEVSNNEDSSPTQGQDLQKTDTGISIKKGTGLIKQWVRSHRSNSLDRRRYRAGHRRQSSKSGELKYPELETIPAGRSPQRVLEELGDVKKEVKRHEKELWRNRRSGATTTSSAGSGSGAAGPSEYLFSPLGSHPPNQPVRCGGFDGNVDVSIEPDSAEVWSRLYDDCIGELSDDDDNEPAAGPSHNVLPSMSEVDRLDDNNNNEINDGIPRDSEQQRSSSTSLDHLRLSTTEFKDDQLVNEASSKVGLMSMVERAWGGSNSKES
ncbi:hypothetical protein FQN50_004319 [Emmonsiellopsis sp. PD_5]|nr:hypothetical protein FQN50_004319 [Emmonsiellopsis sp. PD_5]